MHQISARTLPEPYLPAPDLFAYCPTMDLIATVSQRDSADVWRLNGQRVFGAKLGKDEEDNGDDGDVGRDGKGFVRALGWRRDGQMLAVACVDGTVSLINAFTGKIAHRISARLPQSTTPPSSQAQPHSLWASSKSASSTLTSRVPPELPKPTVSSLSWTTLFASPLSSAIRSSLSRHDSSVTLDAILGLRADVDKLLQLKADLPRELSALDVETSLPKLATLPPRGVGVDDDVFSSRGSVDGVFHSDGGAGGTRGVDVLVVGLEVEDGNGCAVHIRIFDSFEIGTVDVSSVLPSKSKGVARVVRMESHPFLSTVFLVAKQSSEHGDDAWLHLLDLDLSFIPHTNRNLPLVARKATQLGSLLRYISQVQAQLGAEVKAAFDLPTRFLRNANESLAEGDDDAGFVYAAHHLAVTGECDPKLKEWLVDEVGERGLKRWEKAVGDCLEVVRRMTSECLLPALERCLVVLSRLDGLARFGPTSSRLGLDEKSVARVRETVDALGILGEDLLLDVGLEVREFAAFMKWLKWECEVEALEEVSERAEELRETWTGEGELKMVLDYVSGAMGESRLKRYLGAKGQDGDEGELTASFDEDPDIGFYTEYVKRRAGGNKNKDKRMPTLGELVDRLQKQCDAVFGQIADTFRKSILARHLLEMPQGCDEERMDLRVISDEIDEGLYRLFAISRDRQHRGALRHVMITLRQGTGKDVKATTSEHVMATPDWEEILDAKFVDDTAFLVLAATKADARIYSCGITTEGMATEEIDAWELRHVFERGRMDAGMKPARLEVNGRAGRRVVAVLDEAGLGYVVLDLDSEGDGDGGQDDGVGDEVMTG